MFTPSNEVEKVGASLDAFEALTLATMNVASFGVMMVGGAAWAADISSVEELRTRVKAKLNPEGKTDAEEEEDLEEWMASVLARLQGKNQKSLEDMMKELQEKEAAKASKKEEKS